MVVAAWVVVAPCVVFGCATVEGATVSTIVVVVVAVVVVVVQLPHITGHPSLQRQTHVHVKVDTKKNRTKVSSSF